MHITSRARPRRDATDPDLARRATLAFLLVHGGALLAQEAPKPKEASGGADAFDHLQQDVHTWTADPIVVTATRYPQPASDISMEVELVDGQQLLERAPRTVAEALRYEPGLWVQKTGHFGGSPIIRGFMGNQVVYLIDGIRRNTAGLFAGPNPFLQTFDELDVDRIEVVRGPGSVLYGSDAIGGVINVITNEESTFSAAPAFGGRSYSRVASADDEASQRLEGWYSDENMHAFLGGSAREIGDLQGGKDVGTQDPSGWRERDWDGQVDWRLGDHGSVELFHQDFSRPEGRRFDKPGQSNLTADRELSGVTLKLDRVGFAHDLQLTAYSHDQESFTDTAFFDSRSDDETWGLDLQATSFPDDDLRLVYGVHDHEDRVKADDPQGGFQDPDVTWENPAVFALGEWQATDRLRIDLGLRHDSFRFQSQAPAVGKLAQPIQDAIANGALALDDLELDQTDAALTGGLGAIFALTPDTDLVAHVGRAFRAPNKGDALAFGQFTFGVEVPSPDLKPESSWTVESGVRTRGDDWAGSVTLFHTLVNDAIVSEQGTFNGSDFIDVNGNGTEDSDEHVYVNANSSGVVRVTGLELEGTEWLPQSFARELVGERALSCYGNATWIAGRDSGNDEPLDRGFPANVLVGLRVDETRDPALSSYWMGVDTWLVRSFDRIPGDRYASDPAFFDDPQDPSSGPLRDDGSVPGFTIFNLRGGWELDERKTMTVAVENLFNKRYRVKDSRIDEPGINLVLGLDIRF